MKKRAFGNRPKKGDPISYRAFFLGQGVSSRPTVEQGPASYLSALLNKNGGAGQNVEDELGIRRKKEFRSESEETG